VRLASLALLLTLLPARLPAEAKLLVTVVDAKTGEVVSDLQASDFMVDDRGSPREVLAAQYNSKPVDAALLIDATQVNQQLRAFTPGLFSALGPTEQMSVVSFSTTSELVQDFTADKELLNKAVRSLRPGKEPDVVGAVYDSADSGFEHAPLRHVILLVSAGKDAGGRVSTEATLKLLRKKSVSVYVIAPKGFPRWLEDLAKTTGGAAYNLEELTKAIPDIAALGPRILEGVRGNYTLTMAGNLALGDNLKIEINSKRKLYISSLRLD
jgi:hypothetical protein